MKETKLGQRKFAIRKEYLENHNIGGQLISCKAKTFRFTADKVVTVYAEIGNSKHEFTDVLYTIFNSCSEAYAAMMGVEYVEPIVKEKGLTLRTLEIEAMKALVSNTKEFTEESMEVIAKMSKVLAKELLKRNNI